MCVILQPKRRPCLTLFVDPCDANLRQIVVSRSISNMSHYSEAQRARLMSSYGSSCMFLFARGRGSGGVGFLDFDVVVSGLFHTSRLCMSPLWWPHSCPSEQINYLYSLCRMKTLKTSLLGGEYRTNNSNKLACLSSERVLRKTIFLS